MRGWNPCCATDAAAEDEFIQVFVTEFVNGSEKVAYDGYATAAGAEGESYVP